MSFTKEIPFDLTDDEVREYSEQMARGVQDLEAMKEGKAPMFGIGQFPCATM